MRNPPKRQAPVFLLGRAGSGKTRFCFDRLIAAEKSGRAAFYLVPEQSTYLADRRLLTPPGPEAVRHVRVLSFRRLAQTLEEPFAAPDARAIDRAERRILLRSLCDELPEDLRAPFARILDRTGFLESLVTMLRELRSETGPEEKKILRLIAEESELPGELRTKLAILLRLRDLYEERMTERGLYDPELALVDIPKAIRAHPEQFAGIPTYVDGFLSFTRLEMEILVALAQAGSPLTIALCLDPTMTNSIEAIEPTPPRFRIREWPPGFLEQCEHPVFLATLRTYAEMRGRLHAAGLATRTEPVDPEAGPPRFGRSDLQRLEQNLLTRATRSSEPLCDVKLCATRNPTHEVETWARTIDRWTRLDPDPIRPGEIAIIIRDLETYRPLVEETFARFGIPVFVDRHQEILSRPYARILVDALELLSRRWQRDAVIAYLRSPLLGARGGEVDLLENLALERGHDYEKWIDEDWIAMPAPHRVRYVGDQETPTEGSEQAEEIEPANGTARDREDKLEQVRVKIANRLRTTHLAPLKKLGEIWSDGAVEASTAIEAIRDWITATGARTRAIDLAGANRAEAERECDAVDRLLQQIQDEAQAKPLTLESFTRLLHAGLSSLRIGRTPTGLDRVTLAEVQRSRLGEVRRAIVGGLSADQFPRTVASPSYLSPRERETLAALGLDLATPDPLRQEEEAYFFYIALTRASERVLMTRPATDIEGKPLESSMFLREMRAALPGIEETIPPLAEDPAEIASVQTEEELASHIGAYIAARLDRNRAAAMADDESDENTGKDRRILTAYNLIAGSEEGRPSLEHSSRLWGYENRAVLPDEIVTATLGSKKLASSAGRLETFARCPYQHFARHLLRLRPRAKSEITPLENGLLAHRALELLYRDGVPTSDRAEIRRRLKQVFDSLRKEPTLRAYEVDPSGRFRMRHASGQLRRFLELETRRLERSVYRPSRYEQPFGTEEIPPLRIGLDDGLELLLRGRIDRIDLRSTDSGDEALVLDYKSSDPYGRHRGYVQHLEKGLDLQLAVYLLAIEEIFGMRAVGGLYVPVLPRPLTKPSTDEENRLEIKMIGLHQEDRIKEITGGLNALRRPRDKNNRLEDRRALEELLGRARGTLARYGNAIARGTIDVAPVRLGSDLPCKHCDFGSVCRFEETLNPPRSSAIDEERRTEQESARSA